MGAGTWESPHAISTLMFRYGKGRSVGGQKESATPFRVWRRFSIDSGETVGYFRRRTDIPATISPAPNMTAAAGSGIGFVTRSAKNA